MKQSDSGANRGRFDKGREKTGGRQKGTANKASALLKDAILIAASIAGDIVAEERADEILRRTGDMAYAEKVRNEQGGLVGYLLGAALDDRAAYLALLSKVVPLQVQVAETTEVVYRTVEELRRGLTEEGVRP